MIETFFGRGTLDSPEAWFVSLLIGLLFGFALERAGFGSSRRLAGIFYFRDMTVLRVMFTALIFGMLGLLMFEFLGLIASDQVYRMESIYGAQAIGGLMFGVGFVVSGWCPGTAAVGLASGKIDALVFLLGAVGGTMIFNEVYPSIEGLRTWGEAEGTPTALGLASPVFALLLTLVAILAFYFAEWVERRVAGGGRYLGSPVLSTLSVAFGVFAAALLILPAGGAPPAAAEPDLLASVDAAEDHVAPEDLADRLLKGEPGLLVIDVRSAGEYEAFHIRGAIHVPLPEVLEKLQWNRDSGTIVLYSNGMTHPAQARDALWRDGFRNAFILTDGLVGFMDRCLKPVSLRDEPLGAADAARVRAWRAHFLDPDAP